MGYMNVRIDRSLVNELLQVVKRLSDDYPDLENAIGVAKAMAETEEEGEALNTIAVLYREECSGRLDPPYSLKKMYKEL